MYVPSLIFFFVFTRLLTSIFPEEKLRFFAVISILRHKLLVTAFHIWSSNLQHQQEVTSVLRYY